MSLVLFLVSVKFYKLKIMVFINIIKWTGSVDYPRLYCWIVYVWYVIYKIVKLKKVVYKLGNFPRSILIFMSSVVSNIEVPSIWVFASTIIGNLSFSQSFWQLTFRKLLSVQSFNSPSSRLFTFLSGYLVTVFYLSESY